MRRVAVAVIVIVLALAGCTSTTNGSGSLATPNADSTSSGGSGSTTGPGSTGNAESHLSGFRSSWTWRAPTFATSGLTAKTEFVTQDGSRVIVASSSRNSLGRATPASRTLLTALDPRTGRRLWQRAVPGAANDAQPVGDVLVFSQVTSTDSVGGDAVLLGFAAATGRSLWRFADPGLYGGVRVAVLGSSLYVTVRKGVLPYLQRLDATTGKVTAAAMSFAFEPPVAADGVVLTNGADRMDGYDAALRPKWTVPFAARVVTSARLVDGMVLRTDNAAAGFTTTTGYVLESGRLAWTAKLPSDDPARQFWTSARHLVVSTGRSAAAVDAGTGRVSWRVQQNGAGKLAPSATTDDVLVCGGSLVAVDSGDGRTYGALRLPNAASTGGCSIAPVQADGEATVPGLTFVGSPTGVSAYATAVTKDATSRAGDGYGDWGAVDPKFCTIDVARSVAALSAALGGRWSAQFAARGTGVCGYRSGTQTVTVRPQTPAGARRYQSSSNDDGGCSTFGATRGSVDRVPVTGRKLPAGSGACLVTGLEFRGQPVSDLVSGVTRLPSGQWLSVSYLLAHDTAKRTGQRTKIVRMLQRLAG